MTALVERVRELASLGAAVEQAGRGRGSVVLIAGEAGAGKTSLLRAAREASDADFLVGRCEALSVPAPLGPLRELADAAGTPALPQLDGDDRLALAQALLASLRTRVPAVAIVEDAHWADPATLDVLRIIARRLEDEPLALMVTYRDDELAANPTLAMLVGDLATAPAATRLALQPLSLAGVRALAGNRAVDADELLRVTGGNPFLVVELLAAGGRMPPPSVRDAALARVARLDTAGRALVEAAAVIGQHVAPDLLAAVAPDCGEAVDGAIARGVLTDDGATLAFRHELTRQAIEQAIASPRRVALHARVVAALAARAPHDHARLAHHAERAGLRDEASRYASLAAAEAERVGALLEASLQLERALRLRTTPDDVERLDLLLRYARAMNFAGRELEPAREAAGEAVALADALGDRAASGRARTTLSAALWSLDELDAARHAAGEAVELLEPAGDRSALARAYAAQLRIEATAFDPAVVIAGAERALEVAREAGSDEVRVDVTISVGLAHGHRGESERAAALLDAARREARSLGFAIPAIRAHVNAIAVATDARDHARADAVLADALELFGDFQTTIPRQYALVLHARSLLDRGEADGARAELAAGNGFWHGGLVIADAVEALARARRGEPGAEQLLADALASIDRLPRGWRHLLLLAARAEVAWIDGDLAAGRAHAQAALAGPYATQLARPAGDAVVWLARCGGSVPPSAPGAPAFPAPVELELAGEWRAAIRAWHAVHAPYEAALAALPGDERAAREAIAGLGRLGMSAAGAAFARERTARGGAALRSPRRSTLANAAGLTRREQDVLVALGSGATNAQIAAALHLSERTVSHHVSAILGKLRAPTRTAAVQAARAAGLLTQHGPR